MRINRIIYLLMLIASFVFSSFYGGNVPEIIRYFLILVPLLSLAYATFVYVRISLFQEVSAGCVLRGETVRYSCRLKNSDLIPYLDIRLHFRNKLAEVADREKMSRQSLMPLTCNVFDTSICCRYIGVYNIGVNELIIQDFFHLFKFHYQQRKPLKLRVMPLRLSPVSIKPYR